MTFGKTTTGSQNWYTVQKVGTKYHNSTEQPINCLVINVATWDSTITPSQVRLGIIDSQGNLLAVSEKINIPPGPANTPHRYRAFLPETITIPIGDFFLTLWLADWALSYFYDGAVVGNTFMIDEDIDSPTGTIGTLEYGKDFDIYADYIPQGPGETRPPKADFTFQPANPASDEQVVFDATTSLPGWDGNADSSIVAYEWNFGDGNTATGNIVNHAYHVTDTTSFNISLTVRDAQGLTNTLTKSIGIFILTETLQINFENPAHFMVGLGSIWEPSEWPLRNPNNKFEPANNISIRPGGSGITCAKLELLDPSTTVNGADGWRLELLRRWHPTDTHEMWLEGWIYLSADYPQTSQRNAMFRPVYERCWIGTYQWFNGVTLSLWRDSFRPGRPTYNQQVFLITLGQGDVAGGGLQYEDNVLSDIDPTMMPPFGQWFYVRSYIYRDPTNWSNGVVRIWIALPPNYELKLVVDRSPVRTIGIDPALLLQATPNYLRDGYFCSGFSNYVDEGVPPCKLYFDDIILSGVPLGPITDKWHIDITSSGAGSTSPNGGVDVAEGQSLIVTAIPNSGYVLQNWNFNGTLFSPSSSITIPVQTAGTNHSLTAIFVEAPIEKGKLETHTFLAENEVVANVEIVGIGSYATPFTIDLDPQTYTLNCQYQGQTQTKTANITSNQTTRIDFIFQPPPQQVLINIIVTGKGVTTPTGGQQTFNVGDSIQFTAIPNAGYSFNQWKLDGTIYTDNPLTFIITEDMNGKTLTAEFTGPPTPITSAILPAGIAILSVAGLVYYLATRKKR